MKTEFSLPTDTTIRYRRRFLASPEQMWRAYTDPSLVLQWLGYGDFVRCEMDIREGGSFRWEWDLPDTAHREYTLGIHGDVLEVDAPRRLVTSEHMTGTDYPPTRNVVEFTADGDWTVMTGTIEYASTEARDAAYATGMADGMDDSYSRLDALVA